MTYVVKSLSENAFQRQVIQYAKLCGWLVHHVRPARTAKGWRTPIQGHAGFPDLVLVRGDSLLFVELKADDGRVEPHQRQWLDALALAGAVVSVWRPRDWPAIQARLDEG